MTKSTIRSMMLGIMVAAVAMPLHAQMLAGSSASDSETVETVAKVRTEGGVIMISEEGAEFQTAAPDQRVAAKSRLMVSKESAATVIYDDGCKQKFEDPGIYEISQTCVLPVAASGGGVSKGWIIAGVLLGGYGVYEIVDNNNNDNGPPISR
jgi:hypothetical protein